MRVGTRFSIVRSSFVVMIGLTLGASAFAQNARTEAERDLFAAANQARRAQGLPALRWDDSLAMAARRHAAVMAQHGTTQHGYEGEPSLSARAKEAGAHFTWLSENVTQGPTTAAVHAQFMNSPNHRANLLDHDMDSVGIGVAERSGQFFVVEDFSQAR